METRKNTTAGVLVWTPAPVHTSSVSSVISEDEWDDQDQAEKEDDFVTHMDENGIIGLSGALENVELGDICRDAECNPGWYPTLHNLEKADSSGRKRDTPVDELSYSLSDHLSGSVLPDGDIMGSLKGWTEDQAMKRKQELGIEHVPVRGEYLDVIEEMKNGDKEVKTSASKRKENEHTCTSAKLCAKKGWDESYIYKRENKKITSTQSCDPHTTAEVTSHHCPVSQSATAATTPTFPHLLHFTAEEMAAPGIDAETFPEMGFTESLPDSHSSQMSLKSSPHCSTRSKTEEQDGQQAADIFPEQVMAKSRSLKFRQSPDRESRTDAVRTGIKTAEINESRKGPLSYRTPDFSKVEPRVRFPKSGYNPPKSRLSSKKELLSPGPPIVFKSPADIVKEVLLDATDGPPTPSACNRPPTSALSATVPQDFRCRQQATKLLEQLQEDYNRLLTKYAEAENTIDRLRLEAKEMALANQQPRPKQQQQQLTGRAVCQDERLQVNLYSDLPRPSHSMQSGWSDASKFMTLDFAQAERADIQSASHPNGHSSDQSLQVGERLDKVIYNQADKFLQQLQTYQDILKREKHSPSEQMKGLSQLAEGLDSLERGYLLAREEHKRLQQQQGAKISHFDPERELEGLIYECGLHMDELKEEVEQMQQEQPTCEVLPTPPSHSTLSSVTSEGGETLSHPQTPPVPLLVDHGGAVEVEVSSAGEESDEKEAEVKETHMFFYLKPVTGKHRRVEQDSSTVMDQNEEQERHGQRTGNLEVQKSFPQRKVKSDQQDSPPLDSSKQQTSRFGPSSHRTSTQSTTLPVHPSSSCGRLVGKSHISSLSSLGMITTSERRNFNLQFGSMRVLSQDGIISPETDSGFIGSESSHLTPAAARSPLHQRAPKGVAVHQEGRTEKPQTVSTTCPASSSSHNNMDMGPRGASHLPDQLRRSRRGQRRRTFSCSPQHWVSQKEQTRSDSGTSGFGLESDSTHSVSEDEQSDQYAESIHSIHSSHICSSPTVQYHHDDVRALGSSQVVNRKDAIKSLQDEVTTLKERLESCLNNKRPLSSVKAAPSAQDKYNPHYTSTPHTRSGYVQHSDVNRGQIEKQTDNEVEELRRTSRTRTAFAHRQKTQPDILTGSKLEPSSLQPQPQKSRCTQTSPAKTDSWSHTNAHNRQHSVSIQVSDTGKEPDRTYEVPLCPQCSSRHKGRSQWSAGVKREPAHSSHCRHCPVCGRPNPHSSSKPECRRDSESTHVSCQPAESPDRAVKSRFVAASPALLQCMPMYPPPVLLYSSPFYVSPSNSTGTSSAVRGRGEVRERTSCSLSADKHLSLDSSLNRAIRAARHMKHTSRRMAHSLATGLEYQELLTQSCYY